MRKICEKWTQSPREQTPRFAVLNYGKGTKHRKLNTGFYDSLSQNTHQEISAHGESFIRLWEKKSYRLFKVSFVDELG